MTDDHIVTTNKLHSWPFWIHNSSGITLPLFPNAAFSHILTIPNFTPNSLSCTACLILLERAQLTSVSPQNKKKGKKPGKSGLILAILVSTASVERSFFALKPIQTYSRNTTGQARHNSIEREMLMNLKAKEHLHDPVITNFIQRDGRMDFLFK